MIRWLIRHDLPEVLEIEQLTMPDPWSGGQVLDFLGQRNCIGMVAETDDLQLVGYKPYSLTRSDYVLVRMAVHPDFQRQGFGTVWWSD